MQALVRRAQALQELDDLERALADAQKVRRHSYDWQSLAFIRAASLACMSCAFAASAQCVALKGPSPRQP